MRVRAREIVTLASAPSGGGSPGGTVGSRLYTLAGPVVAFELSASTELHPGIRFDDEIVVRDLGSGRILPQVPTGAPNSPPKYPGIGIGRATMIVVKSDGAVAWIVAVGGQSTEYQVHAVDASGSRVLAAGTDVAPSSLALAGSMLYWTQGGKPFSAILN